ncbi:MAG: DNA polymerase I [Hyphomicrobiaceae bacterium]
MNKQDHAAAAAGSESDIGEDAAPVTKGSHVYLIDGSGYIFRAFHALPPLTRPSDGLPVGAVHGFCAMLWKLLRETKASEAPTHIAVVFDAGRETFRNKIFADYKAHRPPPPEELVPQFTLIRDAVRAFNVACVELDGYEADDIIATYARQTVDAGGDATIVSSDKDLMQLVEPGVVMLDGMKSKRIGRDEVMEKFGVPPEKVVEVQALAGDSIDNVPGVPGIGIKTAAELINTYGDLESLLGRASEIKQPKRREKLLEFADQARISRELVLLKNDVPIETPLDQLAVRDPQADDLLAFLRQMEFSTLTKRIAEGLGAPVPPPLEVSVGSSIKPVEGGKASGPAGASTTSGTSAATSATPSASVAFHRAAVLKLPFDAGAATLITSRDALIALVDNARARGRVALSVFTTGPDASQAEIVGLSFALAPGQTAYVPLGHRTGASDLFAGSGLAPGQLSVQEALEALKPVLEDESVLKIGHNLKPGILTLACHGIDVTPCDDVMLLSYTLDAGKGGHGLEDLAERHLGHAAMSLEHVLSHAAGTKKADRSFDGVLIEQAKSYGAEAADIAIRLWLALKPRLAAERMTRVYEKLERPLVPVIVEMERAGIAVDSSILARLSGTFAQRAAQAEDRIYQLAGQKFNLGSPKQLGEFLFDTLKLPGGKRTKSGQWETRAGTLDDLAANEDLPEDARELINTMLEWRQLTKLKSTYTDALPNFINLKTHRIHTSYALAATTTGRLASSDPNLQNIPVRTKEGREIRTAFVAQSGHQLVSADYSQIELRVLAHIADIPQLKRAFADGLDIHAMTASEMFGVPVKDMPGEVRRRAKAINFGIIYGISAFGLANQLGISKQEAAEYISTYFKRFPGIRDYMEATKKSAHANGYVETVFGRRIHYPQINTKNPSMRGFLERAAINAPIQGSAADIIRRAMIRMAEAIGAAKLTTARMLLQVHDELVFEVKTAQAEGLIKTARAVMEKAAEPAVRLSVPIHVDAKAAANWDEAH